jgi:hypothetical protein
MKCKETTCEKPSKHGVRCPHCDFKAEGCAEHISTISSFVRLHLKAVHPDSTMPPQHG